MDTVVYIKREHGGNPVAVHLKCLRQGSDWLAIAEIRTSKGPIRLTATASEEVIKDLVRRGVAKIPPQMISGADIFSTISNFAKSAATRNVLSQAKSVVTNPMFLSALSFVPGLGPAVNVVQKAQSAAQAAENLMGRARQGDVKAQKSINTIAKHARGGSRKASWLMTLLQAADGVRKTFSSGSVDVDNVTEFLAADTGNSWTPPWSSTKAPTSTPAPQAPPFSSAQPPSWPMEWPAQMPPVPFQMPPAWPASPSPGGWPVMPPQASPSPAWPAPQMPPGWSPSATPPTYPGWSPAPQTPQASPGWSPPPQMPQAPPGWSPPPAMSQAPQMPQLPPGTYPQGWPWFPRNRPKC